MAAGTPSENGSRPEGARTAAAAASRSGSGRAVAAGSVVVGSEGRGATAERGARKSPPAAGPPSATRRLPSMSAPTSGGARGDAAQTPGGLWLMRKAKERGAEMQRRRENGGETRSNEGVETWQAPGKLGAYADGLNPHTDWGVEA
eukprot:GHVT01092320.1.p1 GENE.GHVT01092320.1~~GHVT01092320.1.p1  ORF type:complete len:146 (+),score=34.96 GHVT01092320.1:2-439(+)